MIRQGGWYSCQPISAMHGSVLRHGIYNGNCLTRLYGCKAYCSTGERQVHSAAHILYADAKSWLPKQECMPAGTVSCAVQDTRHLTLTIPGADLPLADRRQHFYVLGGRDER